MRLYWGLHRLRLAADPADYRFSRSIVPVEVNADAAVRGSGFGWLEVHFELSLRAPIVPGAPLHLAAVVLYGIRFIARCGPVVPEPLNHGVSERAFSTRVNER